MCSGAMLKRMRGGGWAWRYGDLAPTAHPEMTRLHKKLTKDTLIPWPHNLQVNMEIEREINGHRRAKELKKISDSTGDPDCDAAIDAAFSTPSRQAATTSVGATMVAAHQLPPAQQLPPAAAVAAPSVSSALGPPAPASTPNRHVAGHTGSQDIAAGGLKEPADMDPTNKLMLQKCIANLRSAHRMYDTYRMDVDLTISAAKKSSLISEALLAQLTNCKQECEMFDQQLISLDTTVRSGAQLDQAAAQTCTEMMIDMIKKAKQIEAKIKPLMTED